MYLALIVLPLLGSIASGFFGRKLGVSGSQLITCSLILVVAFLVINAFFEVGLNNIPLIIHIIRWIDSESFNVLWGFNFDSLTVSMLIPVVIISSLVHVYSIGYMSHDPHNQRFFSYLSLFSFMMIILVTANNFLLMFVGWEGVGICSYLLVSFWFTRIAANQSSMSAFLTNRVGDCFLTIGMFALLWSYGNIDYFTIFSLAPFFNESIITIIGICLLIGAMAKSSQVGLHIWLPQAMEGPTPVSALIHAATMVTAGVYLLMRTSPLIEYSSTVLILTLWIGAITTIFSSLIGLFQQDIKKVIAYSTMSQLGMMVIAIGLSSYNIALFHLVNHAFYKGLLFLGAGAVIHAVADNQDFRKYGGLLPFLPLTYTVMLIASLSLVAIPFMTGFYSKDFILEATYGKYDLYSIIVYYIATIGAMFTTLYSTKVLYLTFIANPNGPLINYKQAHEGNIFMSLPLIILAIFSIFFGFITQDIFIGLASGFFSDNSLFTHSLHEIMLDTEFGVPIFYKLLPFFFTVILSILSIIISEYFNILTIKFKFSTLGYNIFSFLNQRFLIELFYNKYITGFALKLGGQLNKYIDKGSIELLGPYGLQNGFVILSNNINSLSTGIITSYALFILIGLIFYISLLYLSFSYENSFLILILITLISIRRPSLYNFSSSSLNNQFIPLHNGWILSVICKMRTHTGSTSDLKITNRLQLLRPTLIGDRDGYLAEAKLDQNVTQRIRNKINRLHSHAQDNDDSVLEDKYLAKLEILDEDLHYIDMAVTFLENSFLPNFFIYLLLLLYLGYSIINIYIKYKKILTFIKNTEFVFILDYLLNTLYTVLYKYKFLGLNLFILCLIGNYFFSFIFLPELLVLLGFFLLYLSSLVWNLFIMTYNNNETFCFRFIYLLDSYKMRQNLLLRLYKIYWLLYSLPFLRLFYCLSCLV